MAPVIPAECPDWLEGIQGAIRDLRAAVGRVEALLVMLSGKLATNPVELTEAVGKALAAAQGYDRITPIPPQSPDLIQTPQMQMMEPWNELQERVEPGGGWQTPDESWWETMHAGTGMPTPPGELDGEGP